MRSKERSSPRVGSSLIYSSLAVEATGFDMDGDHRVTKRPQSPCHRVSVTQGSNVNCAEELRRERSWVKDLCLHVRGEMRRHVRLSLYYYAIPSGDAPRTGPLSSSDLHLSSSVARTHY